MNNEKVVINSKYTGSSFDDYLKENYTTEEIEIIDTKAEFLLALNKLRKEQGLTQKDLEERTGIKQSTIAKIEKGSINPSFNNILKLLNAMGKTLKIASL